MIEQHPAQMDAGGYNHVLDLEQNDRLMIYELASDLRAACQGTDTSGWDLVAN
jgi:hypothetical protein